MKLRAERNDFADAIAWTSRSAASRQALPALAGVRLRAENGRLTCAATDLETSAEVNIPVSIEEPGDALVSAKLLSQIAAKLPLEPVHLSLEGENLEIRCGRATYQVRRMSTEDFPEIPRPDEEAARGEMKADAFQRLVSQVARAASTDDARAGLTGVNLTATTSSLTAAATDSYRLAVRTVPWDQGVEATALVPARSLMEAAKAAGDAGGSVTIVFDETRVSFILGDRVLTTNLIEAKFPDVRSLIPDNHEIAATIDRAQLIEVLQRVAVITLGQPNVTLTLHFTGDAVHLSASNAELGDATESLPASTEGDDITIAFNPGYLLAGLEATGTEQVRIELRDGLKPAVLRPHVPTADGEDAGPVDDLTYLLMPMRLTK